MTDDLIPTNITDITKTYDLNKLQVSNIAIKLLLNKIAIGEATRLNKLFDYRNELEKNLFDIELIPNLPDEEKIERYQLVMSATQSSYNYIQRVEKEINLEELKTQLQLLDNSLKNEELDENSIQENTQIAETANSLLSKLTIKGST